MPPAASYPADSPLPPPPRPEDVLNPSQWATLLAIADVVIPSIKPSGSGSSSSHCVVEHAEFASTKNALQSGIESPEATDLAVRYLEEKVTDLPEFKDSISRVLGNYVHKQGLQGINLILTALNMSPLSLFLTGYSAPFQSHPFHVREAIFRSWESSNISPMRAIHKSLAGLFRRAWIQLSPTLPLVLGFPRVPVHGTPADGFPYEFLRFPPGEEPEIIDTDIVIVGSGCGAGVAAKNLAEAGHRVIVVEKSYHFPERHFPMTLKEAPVHLFSNGGAEISDDGTIAVLSGSTWGGGGTVNWSASLQTQAYVRQEWAALGLPFFTSLEFQNSLDRVCNYMGVSTEHIEHNHGNRVLLEGARKLGFSAHAVPQNTGNQKHYCGYCTLGCAAAIKQGPAVSFLADSARAGAVFIEGFHAQKVLFESVAGKKVACGIRGTWTSRDANGATSGEPVVTRKVIIKAKRVVASCGALQTPLLLLRSGLTNRHIGRNLYLHPAMLLCAVFDQEIRPWEGGILTSVVTEFENLDGHGHGSKIEAISMVPSSILPLFPGKGGLDYKLFAAKLRRMNGFVGLTRDRETGRVYPDPVDGRCRIQYTPSVFDRKNLLEGIIGSAKIAYVSGAKEIHTTYHGIPPFIRSLESSLKKSDEPDEGINNAVFREWIKKFRRGVPLPLEQTFFGSAHQMGTCRMGITAKNSVVDPTGKVWGTEGLYVADASVFPSASGVNPMVTNMAISDWTSRNLSKEMIREKKAVMSRL